jgi:hypothetical protein
VDNSPAAMNTKRVRFVEYLYKFISTLCRC